MKKINLNHKTRSVALEQLKKYGKDAVLDSMRGVYFIMYNDDKKVNTVDKFDADGNNHITVDEIVKHVHETQPAKSRKEIISEIDTNDNGRITKKEVKDWIKKEDK